jgi:hypothetical protein
MKQHLSKYFAEERKKIRELVRESEISLHTYSRSSSWSKKRIQYRAGEKR